MDLMFCRTGQGLEKGDKEVSEIVVNAIKRFKRERPLGDLSPSPPPPPGWQPFASQLASLLTQ